MEEKAKNAVKTFEDLAQAVADSGRPYDAGRIEKAYEMAAAAHAGQTRLSGESYVSHPVAVACLGGPGLGYGLRGGRAAA